MQKPDRPVANNPQEFDPKWLATPNSQWRVIKRISVVNKISYFKNQLYTGKNELWEKRTSNKVWVELKHIIDV